MRVDLIHNMLEEIYGWFVANLQRPPLDATASSSPKVSQPNKESSPRLTFTIYAEVLSSPTKLLLCPNASFHPGWLKSWGRAGASKLFRCVCRRPDNTSHGELHGQQLDCACTIYNAFFDPTYLECVNADFARSAQYYPSALLSE
jgi:hypothetical protein